LVFAVAGANRGEGGAAQPNLGVAGHAGLGGRHSGGRRDFHAGVAIAAIDTQFAHVMLVTERHRLRPGIVDFGDV